MTVSATIRRAQHDTDGATLAFPFPFPLLRPQDVAVHLRSADGSRSKLDGYTVTGSGSAWTVTLPTAPATGGKLTILGIARLEQPLDLVAAEDAALERALDRIVLDMGALAEALSRTIQLPEDYSGGPLVLPDFEEGTVLARTSTGLANVTQGGGGGGGGGGVTSHSALTDLSNDDHPHYLTAARLLLALQAVPASILADMPDSPTPGQLLRRKADGSGYETAAAGGSNGTVDGVRTIDDTDATIAPTDPDVIHLTGNGSGQITATRPLTVLPDPTIGREREFLNTAAAADGEDVGIVAGLVGGSTEIEFGQGLRIRNTATGWRVADRLYASVAGWVTSAEVVAMMAGKVDVTGGTLFRPHVVAPSGAVATGRFVGSSALFDLSKANVHQLTLDRASTPGFENEPALAAGRVQEVELWIIQDGTGSRTFTKPAAWVLAAGITWGPQTSAGAIDRIRLRRSSGIAAGAWLVVGFDAVSGSAGTGDVVLDPTLPFAGRGIGAPGQGQQGNLKLGTALSGQDGKAVSCRFVADASGEVRQGLVILRKSRVNGQDGWTGSNESGYSSGTGGTLQLELYSDSNGLPGALVAKSTSVANVASGLTWSNNGGDTYFARDLYTVDTDGEIITPNARFSAVAGTAYHLVCNNVHADWANNFVSVNVLSCFNAASLQSGADFFPGLPGWRVLHRVNGAWIVKADRFPVFHVGIHDGTALREVGNASMTSSASWVVGVTSGRRVAQEFTAPNSATVGLIVSQPYRHAGSGTLTMRLVRVSTGAVLKSKVFSAAEISAQTSGVAPGTSTSSGNPGTAVRWIEFEIADPSGAPLVAGQVYRLEFIVSDASTEYRFQPIQNLNRDGYPIHGRNGYASGARVVTSTDGGANWSTWLGRSGLDLPHWIAYASRS